MHLAVTDEAKRDLGDIKRHTRRRWGSDQANDYLSLIIESFARLLERPTRGRRQDNLAPGMRRLNVRRHAVFYFVRDESLVIARVVHQSRDIGAGLFVDRAEQDDVR